MLIVIVTCTVRSLCLDILHVCDRSNLYSYSAMLWKSFSERSQGW
ncbi:hypothetical protein [Nostoc sp. PA-18-2419]|nr:hypothetical protein [Nostoc sp. PA-18-2419]